MRNRTYIEIEMLHEERSMIPARRWIVIADTRFCCQVQPGGRGHCPTIWLTLIAIAFLLAAGPDRKATLAAERQPNVVMIVADDQGWTDYGFMGHPAIETPRFDQVAA